LLLLRSLVSPVLASLLFKQPLLFALLLQEL
jgi:hypothetical protein